MNEQHLPPPRPRLLPQLLLLALLLPAIAAAAEPVLSQLAGGLLQEKNTGRVWQMERSKKMHSPTTVQHYLHQLNQGPHQDWRLPTKWELYDLFSKFDLKKNGDVTIALEGSYWLKGDNGSLHPGTWETGDQCGQERTFYSTQSGYVRAVRP